MTASHYHSHNLFITIHL